MKKSPFLSVIMAVYNSEEFLEAAIRSVLNQNYSNFELVIIDDGSTDKSASIIKNINHPRIKLLVNSKNLGLAASLNKAIQAAKGKYIARMDADDICCKQRFRKQIDFMEKNVKTHICGGFIKRISKSGKVYQRFNSYPLNDQQIKADTIFSPRLFHPTVIFRGSFLREHNVKYNPYYKKAQDFELWSRLTFEPDVVFANIPNYLVKYRDVQNKSKKEIRNKLQNEYANKIRIENLKRLNATYFSSHYTVNKLLNNALSKYEMMKFLVLLKDINKKSYARFGAYPNLNEILKIKQFGFWGIKMYIFCKLYRNLILPKQIKLVFSALIKELKLISVR